MARYVHNDRLRDAVGRQAYSALTASAGARAYYDQLRARNIAHDAALRQLANRLVGILHGCLKTRTLYNEATAWPQQNNSQFPPPLDSANPWDASQGRGWGAGAGSRRAQRAALIRSGTPTSSAACSGGLGCGGSLCTTRGTPP
jgi:hypothetical protein